MAYKNREDQRTYSKEHYRRNKALYLNRAKAGKKRTYLRNRIFLSEYLSDKYCIDCGISNILVLEFDHVRGEKSANIADKVACWSITRIKEEIDKCEIRCANCHRIATYERKMKKNID